MENVSPAPQTFHVLICDAIGLKFNTKGTADISSVREYIEMKGGVFHLGHETFVHDGNIHFHYLPQLSTEAQILPLTNQGQFDAVIAAATFIPKDSIFNFGGVRIGAGTGNMGSASWGGGSGVGGIAPLMNTPSFNSRATAQMALKALFHFMPDLPFGELHRRVETGDFDTGEHLAQFPTQKLEGKTIAILGYGNIGREMALLARGLGMTVKIFARSKHRQWIESEGFVFSESAGAAAQSADFISVHTGLGMRDAETGKFANEGLVSTSVFEAMNFGATLINFDRGECVDALALNDALRTGRVQFAAIDADIFQNNDGTVAGPLKPYLQLAQKFGSRILLLPHAAADTCHTSRVDGAKQAVDQIFDCLRNKSVTNLKGDLPPGYTLNGSKTVLGIGKVSPLTVSNALDRYSEIARELKEMQSSWKLLQDALPDARAEKVKELAPKLLLSINRYTTLMRKLGLHGPFDA